MRSQIKIINTTMILYTDYIYSYLQAKYYIISIINICFVTVKKLTLNFATFKL